MIKFAYVVMEDKAAFTKYIEVTLDGYKSGVILNAVMKFCPEPFEDYLNKCYFWLCLFLLALQKFRCAAQSITLEIPELSFDYQ